MPGSVSNHAMFGPDSNCSMLGLANGSLLGLDSVSLHFDSNGSVLGLDSKSKALYLNLAPLMVNSFML